MKSIGHISIFVGFLGLPLLYNSCQQGLSSKKVKQSSRASVSRVETSLREKYCSQTFGVSGKLSTKNTDPFARGKVQLGTFGSASSPSQKSSVQPTLPELVVLIDNNCSSGSKSFSETVRMTAPRIPQLDSQAYRYQPEASLSVSTLEQMAEVDPCVLAVSENRLYKALSIEAQFNDTLKSELKHLEAIEASKAFEILYGPGGIAQESAARDVHIAVIDTGVDVTHPDLENKTWQFSLPEDPNRIYSGFNAVTYGQSIVDYNPVDLVGHGTAVAGIIAAEANNNKGVIGVMPFRSKIMAIRAAEEITCPDETTSPCFGMYTATIINGIRWATLQGADVINLSHGDRTDGPAFDPQYLKVIQDAVGAGVVVVAASGNVDSGSNFLDGQTLTIIPAIHGSSIEGMMTVGSISAETKAHSFYSVNNPEYVEIAAPGDQNNLQGAGSGLMTTFPPGLNGENGYRAVDGTSMSAPIVSAAAGLVVGWVREKTGSVPYPCVVEGIIKESSDNDEDLRQFVEEGRHLNLYKMALLLQSIWP